MNWSRCGLAGVLCVAAVAQSIPEALELDRQGNAAMEQNRHAEAEQRFRQSVEMFRGLSSVEAAPFAAALKDLGYSLAAQGKRREAIANYRQAI